MSNDPKTTEKVQVLNVAPVEAQLPATVAPTSAYSLMMDGGAFDRMERMANIMASGKATIPQHLRNPGDAMAVVMQSMQWGLNPFAVAQKTYMSPGGKLAYEAQLVVAVINGSGLLAERLQLEWFGPWERILGRYKQVESKKKVDDDTGKPKTYMARDWSDEDEVGLGIRVWSKIKGESTARELVLLMSQVRTRNSTLWVEDPKQQIAYLAQTRWGRLYTPDLILGVYTPDELASVPRDMGEVEEVKGAKPSPWTPDVFKAAELAANRGAKEYQKFWRSLTREQQDALAPTKEHDNFKHLAVEVDNRRTVEAPPPPPPPPPADAGPTASVEDVRKRIEQAGNEDALNVALDWADAIPADQRTPEIMKELNKLYDERLAAMRGGN